MPLELGPRETRSPTGWRPSVPPKLREVQLGVANEMVIFAYPYRTSPIRLNDILISLDWVEDADRASIEATIVIDNYSAVARKYLAPGTWIEVRHRTRSGKFYHTLPRLFVWDRGLTDNYDGTSTLTAFDVCSYLQQEGEESYFFRRNSKRPKGWTASQIATQILTDLEMKGSVIPTGYYIPYLLLQGITPWEAIVKAYTRDRMYTGARYRIRAGQYSAEREALVKIDRVVIDPVVKSDYTWEIAQGSNLFSAERHESLEGVKTEYIGVAVSPKTGRELRRVRILHPNARRYGRLRMSETMDPKLGIAAMNRIGKAQLAKKALLTKTASVSAEGIPTVRAMDSVLIRESGTGMSGIFFVTRSSHSVTYGNHTMQLDLGYTEQWPESEVSIDELRPATTTETTTDTAGESGVLGQRVVAFAAAQQGKPYAWGMAGPDSFDCSGLVFAAYKSVGISVPRTVDNGGSGYLESAGTGVASIDQAVAGDILCRLGGSGGGHVGIYDGAGNVWAAPQTGDVVKRIPVSSFRYDVIRRLVPLSRQGGISSSTSTTIQSGPNVSGSGISYPADFFSSAPQGTQAAGTGFTGGGGGTWPGDTSSQYARAQWLAARARKAGLPPELPVMAALHENGLKMGGVPGDNGKAVGLFQIHPERATNDGFSASQRTDPEMQIAWFIQEANKDKSRFASKGPSGYAQWIVAIENPKDSSGSAYAAQLSNARRLINGPG